MLSARPLALLGGTFDPPHNAHLFLAECVRQQFGASRVLFVPVGDPYRKRELRAVAAVREAMPGPAGHRLAMTRLAVAGNSSFIVDDREVRRHGPTYTVDTLEDLHRELRGQFSELLFVLGSDAVADLPNWRDPGRIRELARIVVALKAEGGPASVEGLAADEIVQMPRIPISSTLIRERVGAGLPIRYLLPDAVERYIQEHHLYR